MGVRLTLVNKLLGAGRQSIGRMPRLEDLVAAAQPGLSPAETLRLPRVKIASADTQPGAEALFSQGNESDKAPTLVLAVDTRWPSGAPESYWTISAAANAIYSNIHGYDFIYAVMPEEGARFAGHEKARLPAWCRLVVTASALHAGYHWVAVLDSDTNFNQPYVPISLLTQGRLESYNPGTKVEARHLAGIAQSNQWWEPASPCGGNTVWQRNPNSFELLRKLWQQARLKSTCTHEL